MTYAPCARPYFRRRRFGRRTAGGYLPSEVAARYQFPTGVVPALGRVPTIGIVELGGGYNVPDTAQAFQAMGLPAPAVRDISVQGAANSPGDDADGEVALDVQVAAAGYAHATGQAALVAVAWCPNTIAGFAGGILALVNAGVDAISISWGGPEDSYGASDIATMEAALASAAAAGIPVFVASGDSDSGDGESGNHVDYPASSRYAIACGGTTLPQSGAESVWNDGRGDGTGGGYSAIFTAAPWQAVGPRGVPDVAGDADPNTGYRIVLDGQVQVIGGTSAVAPLWAGLAAALKAGGAGLSDLSRKLYAAPSALTDVTAGGNGAYQAGPGWDPCTGLGTPRGSALLAALLAGGAAPSQPPAPAPPPTPPPQPSPPSPPPVTPRPPVKRPTLSAILSWIEHTLAVIGPSAIPQVEAYLASLGLPAWEMALIDTVLNQWGGTVAAA